MSDPIITIHDSGGTAIPEGTPVTLPTATPGTPTSETVLSVRNNDAGGGSVDPATNVRLTVTGRLSGAVTDPTADGLAYLVQRSLQIRVTAVSGGATSALTEWRPIGTGLTLSLNSIPDGGVATIGVRTSAPLAAALSDVELFLAVDSIQSTPLAEGAYELHGNFVYDGRPGGVADTAFSQILSETGSWSVNGPPDADINAPSVASYTRAGVAENYDGTTVPTFDLVDGDSAVLIDGEAYYALVSYSNGGVLTVTKGSKAATPLGVDDEPTPPAGDIPRVLVTVPFSLAIDTIELRTGLGFFGLSVVSGLQVSVGPGQGAVGGRWVDDQTSTTITLTDSQTSTIYRLPETGYEALLSTTAPTDAQSMPLWDVVTSGGAVTSQVDRRRIGSERRGGTMWGASFTVGAPAAGAITVNVQLEDGLAQAVTAAHSARWYLSTDAAGLTPATTAPDGGVAAGTDGALIKSVADLSGWMVSETGGDVDVVVTESVSTTTFYLVVVVDGRLSVSSAITPTP